MKKILSLLSLLMLCVVGMNAQTTIYSWESPEGTPVETGGTIAYVNGDGDRLNYLNNGNYTICLNGKKANLNDETASANAGHMVITLDEALAAGDEIAITGYITKNESKKASAYILYENGTEAESPYFSDDENIDATFGGSIATKTVTVSAEAAGSKTITMTRGQTGTNLFITKLVITRSVATKTIGLVPGVWTVDDATFAAYAFNSDEDNKWFPFVEASGAYGTQIPDSYAKIILVRLKPSTAEGFNLENYGYNWANKWNQTDDIDFTAIADQTIFSITGWGEDGGNSTYTAATPLDAAKAALQAAIDAVSAYGFPDLNDAIAAAQAAVNAEDATIESLQAAGAEFEAAVNAYLKGIITMALTMAQNLNVDLPDELKSNASALVAKEDATTQELANALFALLNTAQPYVKNMLAQAVELAKLFGVDTEAAEALLAKTDPEATTIEMYPVLDALATACMGPAHQALNTLKSFIATFDGAAEEALADDFAKLEADFTNKDLAAVKADIATLMANGKPYLQTDIAKLEGYVAVLGNETISGDVAAMKAAIETENFAGLYAALKQFETDLFTAAPGIIEQVKFAAAGYKDAGKTNGMGQLEAAIEAAEAALGAEDKTVVTVGLAVRNLILATQAFYEANKTYTIAGTKDLTGTEEAWQIAEANNMTLDTESGLYTWTAENITVTAEAQPQFKVVITDIDGKQTWVPASEEGDDHNWVITPDVVGGEGVYNITITYNVKTQEIAVTGVKQVVAEEDAELVAPEGWTNAITNGNLAGDDVTCYVAKEYPSTDILPATIVAGAGKNGSRGILVKTADDANAEPQAWDSQFWILLPEEMPDGSTIHVEFDYKASKAAKGSTQAHGDPGNYLHWSAIGDVNFTTEWQHFSANMTVAPEANGMKSIAFNLQEELTATEYYFDNFGVWYQAPKEITEWADIIVNGDMEGDNAECFYVTEQGVGGPFLAEFTDGIGVDGSKAIKVQSIDDVTEGDHEAQDWDTQFFVRLPYQIPAGTKYKVSFDYKADKAGGFDTQAHTEPGSYIHWECVGSGSFTTAWQTYSAEGTISADMSKTGQLMQTIAFNLAKNRTATEFIFDNVKFEVDADIVAELTKNPAVNPTSYPHGIIPDGTYYVMNANEGTLINAESALDAKGAPITFTFDKYSKTFTIEGADIFAGKQWTIADAVEGMSGYYTISTAEGFLAATEANTLEQIADGTADAAVWILLEKAYWEDIVNSTYTVAGTKNLTGTENDWDVAEANQMTYNEETQLFEKKFKRIAINAESQPEFKVVQTNIEGESTWYPEGDGSTNWVITTDYVGGEGLYDITITFDPSDFKEIGVIPEKRIVFPENAIVYDFEAAADAGENPANKNGSAANGQAFYGWENPEKTDSKRQDYKGYEWAEGSLLPEVCHVWRRSDRINGNVADNGGLKCPSNKEMAIDGLNEGDKVIIVYDAENATDKEIIWAIGDGSSDETLTDPRATATIDGIEAVTGETTIASGAEIVVNSVTPAENVEDGTGYIVFQVKKGMIIKQVAVIPSNLNTYTATFTTNAGWEKAYAYAWTGDGETAVKFLGDWPGKEMTPGNGGNDWKISFKAEAAPEKIIFNNGGNGAQTADLDFEDGKAYEFTINNEWADAIAAAQALAEEDGVAVGKLIAAIGVAQGITEPTDEQKAALQTAVDQYKLDNADQEKDETAKVATNGWKKFDGSNAGVCATQFAPAITTYDGRTAQLAEVFEGNGDRTGTIIYQDITGLENGTYKVGFYGNAFSTSTRDGFECTMEDGATDVAYVFANDEKEYISARIATSTTENDFRQFDVEVTDGNIKLGMGKDTEKSTNWHTMQIYQLTWFTTAKEVFAQDQEELKAVIAEAKALLADETKTEGKEALELFVYAAEQVVDSKMYNIAEVEAVIGNLKDLIAGFKKANWYIDLTAGEYYIIDVESGLKMAAGHDWGTRGIVNERGLDLTLTPYTESRTVTIDSRVYNGDTSHFLGENLYMDSSEWGWALEYQGFGFYILEPNGGKYINIDKDNNLVLSDTPREFIIVTKDGVRAQLLEELSVATKDAPVDATGLITANNFNRNDARNAEAWIVSEDCTNSNLSGGNNVNNCAESFHSTFTIMQTISGAPAGIYQLTAQGFYRQDEFEGDAPAAPQFFANEVNADVPVKSGSENGMSDASASFTNGLYTIEPINFEVKDDGMMYIGITASTNTQWVIWDNFQLKYLGNITTGISDVVVKASNDGAIYNLSGQKVTKARKGLYIINGKKMVVK